MSSLDKYILVSPESSGKLSGGWTGGRERLDLVWSAQTGRGTICSARPLGPRRIGPDVLHRKQFRPEVFHVHPIPAFRTSALALSSPRLTPPSSAQPSLPHPIGNPHLFCKQPDLWCRGSTAVALCKTGTHYTSILLTIHPNLAKAEVLLLWTSAGICKLCHDFPSCSWIQSTLLCTYLPCSSVIDNPLMSVETCQTSVMSSTS